MQRDWLSFWKHCVSHYKKIKMSSKAWMLSLFTYCFLQVMEFGIRKKFYSILVFGIYSNCSLLGWSGTALQISRAYLSKSVCTLMKRFGEKVQLNPNHDQKKSSIKDGQKQILYLFYTLLTTFHYLNLLYFGFRWKEYKRGFLHISWYFHEN